MPIFNEPEDFWSKELPDIRDAKFNKMSKHSPKDGAKSTSINDGYNKWNGGIYFDETINGNDTIYNWYDPKLHPWYDTRITGSPDHTYSSKYSDPLLFNQVRLLFELAKKLAQNDPYKSTVEKLFDAFVDKAKSGYKEIKKRF